MNRVALAILGLILPFSLSVEAADSAVPLGLVQTIPLSGVEGRIDHLAVDLNFHRLFVAALGNNTLEVIDLRESKLLRSIPGLAEPQGVACAPDHGRIFVANGESGVCAVFDSAYSLVQSVSLGGDADNVRYDRAGGKIWVGFGDGALGALDAATGRRAGDIRLKGHPESFQLETHGPRIFVNVPSAGNITVIDRVKMTVTFTWPVKAAAANYPMALDEFGRRLIIGCRSPARVLLYDMDTGAVGASLDIAGDTDDLFWDNSRRRLYVICGEGVIKTFQESEPGNFTPLADTRTAPGARTGLFVPELGKLYLAVPHRGTQAAEIREYNVE